MKYSAPLILLLLLAAIRSVCGQIPWPVPTAAEANPQPVLGTLGELRKPPLSSTPHLHNGVDIAGPRGTAVFTVGQGCVGQVLHRGERFESVRIGNFTYVHVAVSEQLKQGACVGIGALVGHTNSANHVHLIWHGSGGLKLNALLGLLNYSDLQPPAAPTNLAVFDDQGTALPRLNSGDYFLTSPRVSIEAEAGDIEGSNTLGVFELCSTLTGISVGASAGPGETCRLLFGSLPPDADVDAVYTVSSSTVENGNFRLIYKVTNFNNSQGFLETDSLVPGRYKLTVVAKDIQSATAQATTVLSGPESAPTFLIKPAILTVKTSGTGSGTVTLSPVPSLTCGSNCYQIIDFATPITLTTVPGSDSTFSGWSGDCTGTAASIPIVVSKDKSCTATFQSAALVCTGGLSSDSILGSFPTNAEEVRVYDFQCDTSNGKIPLRLAWQQEQCSPSACTKGGLPPVTSVSSFFIPFNGNIPTTWDPPPNLTFIFDASWSGFITVTATGSINGRTFSFTIPSPR